MRRGGMTIEIKTPEQIAVMREAGLVVARTLRVLAAAVRPGITTAELDALAEAEIRAAGATPSFKGYHGYPATICTSVNEEIVHGIPSPQRSLREGDIVSIDCGAIVGGWHGDAAVTVGVGAISAEHARLLQACETALWRGIAQAQAGGRLGDISHAVETSVGASGRYGVVEEYTGHGIGSAMHMDPPVPNYGRPGRGPRLRPGMALAIEPMVMLGSPETVLLDDGWTVVTADGSWAAHFEHTVAITPDGPWVLTAEDGAGPGRATGGSLGDTRKEGCCEHSADLRRCPVPGDPRIRASDADRDRVAALLREHHAAGRLTAEEFGERMERALDAKTLGELDELLTDLPAIDLYQLPDASLRRAPPHLGQSLLPADRGGSGDPVRFTPGTVAMGAWAVVTSALVAIWAVAAVVGGGTWFPWWALIAIPWIWAVVRRAQRRGE